MGLPPFTLSLLRLLAFLGLSIAGMIALSHHLTGAPIETQVRAIANVAESGRLEGDADDSVVPVSQLTEQSHENAEALARSAQSRDRSNDRESQDEPAATTTQTAAPILSTTTTDTSATTTTTTTTTTIPKGAFNLSPGRYRIEAGIAWTLWADDQIISNWNPREGASVVVVAEEFTTLIAVGASNPIPVEETRAIRPTTETQSMFAIGHDRMEVGDTIKLGLVDEQSGSAFVYGHNGELLDTIRYQHGDDLVIEPSWSVLYLSGFALSVMGG